jgi:cytochrome c-type biogenesis protein
VVETPALTLAFAAGLVSFLSPCCLPLVPGYLATVSGVRPGEAAGLDRLRLVLRSLLFVGTFSLIFILLGLSATLAGSFLTDHQDTLNRIAGVTIILLGLLFVASPFVPRLARTWHPQGLAGRAGAGGPVLAGAAFAVAWTPCVGPTLGAILSVSATADGTARGGLLLAVYSAGLALPFIASALAFGAATTGLAFFRRHYTAVQVLGGIMLIVMGALVLSGELFRLNIEAQQALDALGLNFWSTL